MSEDNAREEQISIAPLARDGDKLLQSLKKGRMVAVLSGTEILYTLLDGDYLCYIHPLGAPEGRAKRLPDNAECRAVVKNLADLADQLFEIEFSRDLDRLGVMQAAEQGILEFLEVIGRSPGEDLDFMTGQTVKP